MGSFPIEVQAEILCLKSLLNLATLKLSQRPEFSWHELDMSVKMKNGKGKTLFGAQILLSLFFTLLENVAELQGTLHQTSHL